MNSEAESDQILTETAIIPEDITAFYEKIDKEDEDEEDHELKIVSFEVNQVYICFNVSNTFNFLHLFVQNTQGWESYVLKVNRYRSFS